MGSIGFSQPAGGQANASTWLAPVQAVFAFFAPPQIKAHAVPNQCAERLAESVCAAHRKVSAAHPARRYTGAPRSGSEPSTGLGGMHVNACAASSLKILREFEPGKSRSSTGRLVISGRMADVCEVLDRMATQSTATH
jgi:hypothetical protein